MWQHYFFSLSILQKCFLSSYKLTTGYIFAYFNSIVTVYQKIQYISFVCEIAVKVTLLDNLDKKKSDILLIFH